MKRRATRIRRGRTRQIENPIHVFISSSQKEFQSLRQKLKARIDVLRIEGTKRIFVADLVEKQHGDRISYDVNKSLDIASIYVAIIGDSDSKWTMDEFDEAWIRGIPLLVYDYRGRNTRRSTISRWLDDLKRHGVRIEVPEAPYRNADDVVNHVIDDLPDKLGELAEKYQKVRNVVARKNLFGYPGR